jgi:diguanylate cyclase (GGDEF)-like protein
LAQREGTTEALLIDARGGVLASKFPAAEGTRDWDPEVAAALTRGASFAGRDTDPARRGDYEFIVPVNLPWGRFAYQTSFDHRTLDRELSDLRRTLALVWLLALGIGGGVFYLVGGRALMRSHQIALRRATRDGLTDLPNHRAFQEELASGIAQATRYGEAFSLLLLDIDDFKLLNDGHGHLHGDQVLKNVAAVLREGRVGDRAFRIGGDEFALILPKTDTDGAHVRARRLLRAFGPAGARASVGIGTLSGDVSGETLRAQADVGLYESKRRGGHQATHFQDIDHQVTLASSDKQQALIRLIGEERIETVYQPIWDLSTGTLIGLEALTRPDPEYGFSGPEEAFNVAEQMGRVRPLDILCATRAVRVGAQLPEGALLFINLSPHTLELDSDGDEWFHTAVQNAQLLPERVVVEVTERFSGRTEAVVNSLKKLRDRGFKVALDDVGTGNAGLEMLRQVDADFVKLDRSIVAAATTEPTARAVLMAMATFAHGTGSYVIAEGIEDQETLDFLDHIGKQHRTIGNIIRGGQGFGLGRPSGNTRPEPPRLRP